MCSFWSPETPQYRHRKTAREGESAGGFYACGYDRGIAPLACFTRGRESASVHVQGRTEMRPPCSEVRPSRRLSTVSATYRAGEAPLRKTACCGREIANGRFRGGPDIRRRGQRSTMFVSAQ